MGRKKLKDYSKVGNHQIKNSDGCNPQILFSFFCALTEFVVLVHALYIIYARILNNWIFSFVLVFLFLFFSLKFVICLHYVNDNESHVNFYIFSF